MNLRALLAAFAAFVALCFGISGCYTPPQSGYVPAGEEGVMTIALDDHDYDLAVQGIVKEMLERGLPTGCTVVLGPVDTKDCPYDVRVITLQKSLQARLNKEGTLKFFAAVDAMRGAVANDEIGNPGQIYKLIEYNWNNRNPIDVEDLQKFGKLAKIKGILFGRVSSMERAMQRGGKEITYRFVWELANTETGVTDITHEEKIRKQVK
jgi:hypothetical protein